MKPYKDLSYMDLKDLLDRKLLIDLKEKRINHEEYKNISRALTIVLNDVIIKEIENSYLGQEILDSLDQHITRMNY